MREGETVSKRLLNVPSPKLTLQVSEEIIEQAVPEDSGHCMIADAVREAYPDARFISVDIQTIRFTDRGKGERYTFMTPRAAQRALLLFDHGLKPAPFSFQLRDAHITEAGRQVSRRKATPAQAAAGRANLRKSHLVQNPRGGNAVPVPQGGEPPPMGALAHGSVIPKNRRRAFGLRAAGY